MDRKRWVLVTGDLASGFALYGPYESQRDAEDARDHQAIQLQREAWVMPLHPRS